MPGPLAGHFILSRGMLENTQNPPARPLEWTAEPDQPLYNVQHGTTYGSSLGGTFMLRLSVIAALVLLATSAFGQLIEAKKDIKFGAGCLTRMSTFGPRLGTCEIVGSKARIWCPNGEIFDRTGAPPQSVVARSMCNLSQVLD